MGGAASGPEAPLEVPALKCPRDEASAPAVANDLELGLPRDSPDRNFKIEGSERLHGIRVQGYAGADFFQLGRSFVDSWFKSSSEKRTRRREAANATTDNRNAGCALHGCVPST
jgi:hypothetical protein